MSGSSVHAGLATTVVAVVRRQLRSAGVPTGLAQPRCWAKAWAGAELETPARRRLDARLMPALESAPA